ncbi:MAG: arginine--tRNA ligase [Planctomycetota bacterium]
MKSVLEQLSRRVAHALAGIGVEGDPLIAPSQDDKFGDYQSNAAMGLAKKLGRKPREVAQAIIDNLRIDDLCEPPEIAGPGFINFRLRPDFLARSLQVIPPCTSGALDRVGLEPAAKPETIVVDLSSPNLAKEMHVGHLRSTVIGDCIARVLESEGHNVIRENHVGDWGTQFGMLVAHLRRVRPDVVERPDTLEIADLESFYIEAKARFDADEEFRAESRETVVALQKGDPTIRRIWKAFCDESLRHCHAIYERLGVRLIDRGESFYNDLMDEVIRRLESVKTARPDLGVTDSEGALCIFPEGFKTRDGQPLPLIVRKSDGGYNYATSDLATILHRIETLHASRIVYVVGLSQKQHFEMLFAAARKVGWVGPDVRLEHLGFGNMLAAGGQPFKTREGGTIKLKNLLDEAVSRAKSVITEQSPDETKRDRNLPPEQIDRIAETVGLGAVKYFDLLHSMTSDYTFDVEIMLSLEGNTAPYMMYAYARVRSIGRKAGVDFATLPTDAPIILEHAVEIALAKKLLQFAEKIELVARELRPNVLTDYLYDLAKAFSRFYDKKLGVRVIDATPESVRHSRLRLCDLTARVLKLGLHLLGIDTIEQM